MSQSVGAAGVRSNEAKTPTARELYVSARTVAVAARRHVGALGLPIRCADASVTVPTKVAAVEFRNFSTAERDEKGRFLEHLPIIERGGELCLLPIHLKGPMRFSDARERYVQWLFTTQDMSPHTVRAYSQDTLTLQRFLGEDASITEFVPETFQAFLEEQHRSGLSPVSIRRRVAGLRGFSRWLVANGWIEGDPIGTACVVVVRSRKLPRTVPQGELFRLIRHLRERAEIGFSSQPVQPFRRPHEATTLLAVVLMASTGMRVHEIVGLRCEDIDLHDRSIRLTGKGRRERQAYLANDWIFHLTASYLSERTAIDTNHPYLFFNNRYGPLTTAAMRSRVIKAGEDANLTRRVTPHMLRHTAATQLIDAGVDIRFIQRLLGHASLTTTEIYTHVSDTSLKRVITEADVLGKAVQLR